MDAIFQVIRRLPKNGGTEPEVILRRYRGKGQSTKVRALINHLRPLFLSPEERKPVKVVVFSQFTSFLDKIQEELNTEGFNVARFDGSMNQKSRANVLEDFKTTPESFILLLSMKAGGVGLNLVCANRAYLMDPWWSYAVESQAIDRIHRMGQSNEVQIVRFIVENSVEERMLKIQERKKFLATTLGLSEEDKRAQRLEDIKTLFEM